MGRKHKKRSYSDEEDKENSLERRLKRLEKIITRQSSRSRRKYRRYESSDIESSDRARDDQESDQRLDSPGPSERNSPPATPPPALQQGPPLNDSPNHQEGVQSAEPSVTAPLDENVLQAIGKRLEPESTFGLPIHSDLAVRWQEISKKGLPDEDRSALVKKYSVPDNCTEISPAKLNPEVKASLPESVCIRDARLRTRQDRTASCLSALGSALTMLLKDEKVEKLLLLEMISDAGRLLVDLQRDTSFTRRSLVLANVNASARAALEATEIQEFLFGKELEGHIKATQAIERTCKILKPTARPAPTQQSKNAKGPPRPQWRRPKTSGGHQKSYAQRSSHQYHPRNQDKSTTKRTQRHPSTR